MGRKSARHSTSDDAGTSDQFGVQSVEIAAELLKTLAGEAGAVALKRLAAAAGMPRAKAHRYLVSLRRAGLVAQDRDTGYYRIGPSAVTIGLVGIRGLSPLRHIHDALPALRDRIDQTVTLTIWGEMGPTVIAMEESSHVVTMNVRVGSVLPVLSTAIGRLFAAYLPAATIRRFTAAERRKPTAAGRRLSDKTVAAMLAEIRQRRLSRAHAALLPGVDALAAPIFDHTGTLLAVICAVGRPETLKTEWDGKVARTLGATAQRLSRELGFSEPKPSV